MSLKRAASLAIATLTATLLLLGGCGGDGGGGGGSVGADPIVIFVNASTEGPLAFFLNDEQQGTDLAPKTVTAPIEVPFRSEADGGYDMTLEPPDRSDQYDNLAMIFQKDTNSLIAAIGIKNPIQGEEDKRLREIFQVIDRKTPNGNRSRLFIVHGFNRKEGFTTPSLIFQNYGDNPQFQTEAITYGSITTLEVDAKEYSTTSPDGNNHWIAKDAEGEQIYCEIPKITLQPGTLYVVLATGVESQNQNETLALTFLKVPTKD
ncbi:MAG: DUF4397 domain-containing protein [Armatimonadetes bacterium]|nr:DUF4397 domain-containing protein [Armatimonadota bacterium]